MALKFLQEQLHFLGPFFIFFVFWILADQNRGLVGWRFYLHNEKEDRLCLYFEVPTVFLVFRFFINLPRFEKEKKNLPVSTNKTDLPRLISCPTWGTMRLPRLFCLKTFGEVSRWWADWTTLAGRFRLGGSGSLVI